MEKPEQAEKAAADYRDSIAAAIANIATAVDTRPRTVAEGLDWGHVGSLGHIDALLAEVARFVKS